MCVDASATSGSGTGNADLPAPNANSNQAAGDVPAGADIAHSGVLRWRHAQAAPGHPAQFQMVRGDDNASDTCGSLEVTGRELRY